MLELSAHPDTAHALGVLVGMVYNVWVKLGIYAVLMCGGQNPGFWFVRPSDGSPDMYK